VKFKLLAIFSVQTFFTILSAQGPTTSDNMKKSIPFFAAMDRYENANQRASKVKVVLIGDSITEGWWKQDSTFFKDQNYVGRGISGQTSPQLLVRFRQDVINLKPKAVVIHIGTNDIAQNTGPYLQKYTLQHIQSMIDLAKMNEIKVFLASVLPATQFKWRPEVGDQSSTIVALNEAIKELAVSNKLTYIDYHSAMKNSQNGMDPSIAPDGVHPNKEGFEIMKGVLTKALGKI
jgi:lysophospholipase L1-like esterase